MLGRAEEGCPLLLSELAKMKWKSAQMFVCELMQSSAMLTPVFLGDKDGLEIRCAFMQCRC